MPSIPIQPENQSTYSRRRVMLHAMARAFVTEGLGKRNFESIPYHANVHFSCPDAEIDQSLSLTGRELLRTRWWIPLLVRIQKVEVIDTFVNDDLTRVSVRYAGKADRTPVPVPLVDFFSVNQNGEIFEQEHFWGLQMIEP